MRSGPSNSGGSRHWRLSAKLLIASSVATVIGFSAICASVQALWLGQNLWVYHRDRARCGDALFG